MQTSAENEALPLLPVPFRRTSRCTVEMQEGGGWLALPGLLCLLGGVFFALSAARAVPSGPASELKRLALGLVFLGAGSLLVFGRRWLTLDTGSGFLTRRYGILIPMHNRERPLGDFNAVVVAFELGSDSPDRYPVKLRARSGKDVAISSLERFGEARKQAEFLSRFLRLPLADITTDHELVVSPERAGETLRERLLSTQAQAEVSLRPPAMRCKVDEAGGTLTVAIPGRMSPTSAAFYALVPCVVILIVIPALWGLSGWAKVPMGVRLIFLGLLVYGFGLLPLVEIIKRRNRTMVRASQAGLVIERPGVWRRRATAISAADILDLDYRTVDGILGSARRSAGVTKTTAGGSGESRLFATLKNWVGSKGIIVKSRQGEVTFGEGLAVEELQFLRSVLTKALVG